MKNVNLWFPMIPDKYVGFILGFAGRSMRALVVLPTCRVSWGTKG